MQRKSYNEYTNNLNYKYEKKDISEANNNININNTALDKINNNKSKVSNKEIKKEALNENSYFNFNYGNKTYNINEDIENKQGTKEVKEIKGPKVFTGLKDIKNLKQLLNDSPFSKLSSTKTKLKSINNQDNYFIGN